MPHRPPQLGPRTLHVVDWRAGTWLGRELSPCAYAWVDDASIRQALRDLTHRRRDWPNLRHPHDATTDRALRVAAMVFLLGLNVPLDPLVLDLTAHHAYLRDGHHRLRALQYLMIGDRVCVAVAGLTDKEYHADSPAVR